jgi:transposase-like protein
MIYECPKCTKKFKQKSHYNTHLNKKIPCHPPIVIHVPIHNIATKDIQLNTNNTNKPEILKDNKFKCVHCLKTLSREDALQRHIANYCKVKRKNNIIEANNNKSLMDMLEEMKNEIASLQKMCTEITEKNNFIKDSQNMPNGDIIPCNFEIIDEFDNNDNNNDSNKISVFEMEQLSESEIVNSNEFEKSEVNLIAKPNKIHNSVNSSKHHNYYVSNNSALIFDGTDWILVDSINNVKDLIGNDIKV